MKQRVLSLVVALIATTVLWAYSFKSGDLCYNIISTETPYTVEVTCEYEYNTSQNNYPTLQWGNIVIPDSVTFMGMIFRVIGINDMAFHDCYFTSITIPQSITSISNKAFYSCYVSSMVVDSGNMSYDSRDNCNAIIETSTNTLVAGCTNTIIPEDVMHIGDYAFRGYKQLTSITIPESVISIGREAFYYTGLTTVVIPNSVMKLGDEVFSDCTDLTSATLSNHLKGTGVYAFHSCSKLTNVVIPNGIESIGSYTFEYCYSLESITLPNSLKRIEDMAFSSCRSLKYFTIPSNVTYIGGNVFEYCSFNTFTIKSSTPPQLDTDYRGYETFHNCSVRTIYIPCGTTEAYTSIKWGDFSANKFKEMCSTSGYEISVISADTIKGKVNFIFDNSIDELNIFATANPHYQFSHWSDGNTDNPRVLTVTQDTTLIAHFVPATSGKCSDNLYWSYGNDTLSITGTGDMYDYEADSANASPWLLFLDSISEVIFPEGITYIGTHAFRHLPLLTEATITNAIEEIGESAFAECTGLGKVVIGSGNSSRLTTLGDSVFIHSRKLCEIHIAATEPPMADHSTFLNYNVHLYVPCESKDKYDLDMVFGDFKYIECLDTDAPVEDFSVTPAQTSAKFVWGAPSNASTYTLDLQQEDAPFFTLVFNATGQLHSISLAPIGSQVRLTAAERIGSGFTFNATGLTPRTLYNYDLTIRDAAEVSLQNYSGYFYTTSDDVPTGTDDADANKDDNAAIDDTTPRKVFRNGQVLILRGGKTYTVTGEEVE